MSDKPRTFLLVTASDIEVYTFRESHIFFKHSNILTPPLFPYCLCPINIIFTFLDSFSEEKF